MPDWTKMNFRELEDRSPPDVPMQWRFARHAVDSPLLGVSWFTYEPGARMPFGHRHRLLDRGDAERDQPDAGSPGAVEPFAADATDIAAQIGRRALDELLAAHRLWSDWLGSGRVRKLALVAEKRAD